MGKSLKDIADSLGLSKTTVSWTLSGKAERYGISEATQEKVRAKARELGYQPNLLARSLHSGSTRTIGLILPDITDYFFADLANRIEEEAASRDFCLMIGTSASKLEQESRLIRMFRNMQVDGILLAPTKTSYSDIEWLVKDRYPLVLLGRYFPEIKTSYVVVDNVGSTYRLVSNMIKRGCRKIACIVANPHLRPMSRRQEGYRQALADNGLTFDKRLFAEVSYEDYTSELKVVMDRILREVPDVDGFFFSTHFLCLSGFCYFFNHGIDARRFEMACVHGQPFFECLSPKLHVARMPVGEIARQTVSVLCEQMRPESERALVPPAVREVVLQCSYPDD